MHRSHFGPSKNPLDPRAQLATSAPHDEKHRHSPVGVHVPCPLQSSNGLHAVSKTGIVINDVSGPALSNIYIGFTTARGTASADNQNISIYNLLLRSQ